MQSIQRLKVDIVFKPDLMDRIKILFGKVTKVESVIEIAQEQPIMSFNAHTSVSLEGTTTYFVKQSHPQFGWSPREDLPPVIAPESTQGDTGLTKEEVKAAFWEEESKNEYEKQSEEKKSDGEDQQDPYLQTRQEKGI